MTHVHGALDPFIAACIDSGKYRIENDGRIWNLDYRGRGKVREVTTHTGPTGYSTCALSLWVGGQVVRKSPVLHNRLVAIYFLGLPPGPDYDAEHKDANRLNCARSNIEWLTKSENARGANRRLREKSPGRAIGKGGEGHPYARLTVDQAREAHRRARAGESYTAIARRMGVIPQTVWALVTGVTWPDIYREFHPE